MSAPAQSGASGEKVVAVNRRAWHDYEVHDRLEAGVVLKGSEVKAIRGGRFSLAEAYAGIKEGEAYLFGFHVQPYEFARAADHDPLRPKKLLLHRREIDRLFGLTSQRGVTLIPLRLYFRQGKLKVELGVCKGKRRGDRRETLRRRIAEREVRHALSWERRR